MLRLKELTGLAMSIAIERLQVGGMSLLKLGRRDSEYGRTQGVWPQTTGSGSRNQQALRREWSEMRRAVEYQAAINTRK